MAGVTVEFGAKDTGLAKSLETVRQQLNQLNAEVQSGELSFDELQQAMRKIAQAENVDKKLKEIATATDNAGDEAKNAAADFDRLDREMDQVSANSPKVSTGFAGVKDTFGKVATSIAGVVAALKSMQVAFDFMKEAVMSAAALEETMNKVNVVFQEGAADIQRWANAAGPSLAMTRQEAADAASTFAIFGKSAGLSGDNLVGFSTRLTRLATDMASFNNSTPEEGVLAIGAALRGETEPIRRFGVLLDDATLKNRALQMGLIDTTTGALTPQQRVLAAYNEILAQTTDQQGDFERTSGSLSNQLKILEASTGDLQTKIGEELTPSTTYWVEYANSKLIPALEGMAIEFKRAADAAAGLARNMNIGEDEVNTLGTAAVMLGGQVNPLAGIFNQARMAINYFSETGNDARDAAAEAAEGVEDLGSSAIGTSSELDAAATSADGLGASLLSLGGNGAGLLGGVNKGAAKLNSLLGEGETNLADMRGEISSQTPLINEQVALRGELNTMLGGEAEQLSAQLGILDAQGQAERDRNQSINERQQLSLQDYESQIAINQAIADGNSQEANALETKRELARLADEIAKKTGLSAEEALDLAAKYLISENNARLVTEEAGRLASAINGAGKEADDLGKTVGEIADEEMERGAKGLRERTKDARDEMKNLESVIGKVGGMSLDDMLRKMGMAPENFQTTEEKLTALEKDLEEFRDMKAADVTPYIEEDGLSKPIQQIKRDLKGVEDERPDGTPQIDKEDFKNQVDDIVKELKGLEDTSVTTDLDATKSIAAIREELGKPIEVELSPKAGGGDGNTLATAVEAIKAAVEKIEQKLPMQALAA